MMLSITVADVLAASQEHQVTQQYNRPQDQEQHKKDQELCLL